MKTGLNHAASDARASPQPVGDALAELVAALCRMIAQGLSRKSDRHGGVHRARKAIRSVRAILALTGDALNDEAADIDRSLQQLARGLSALRDAHVAVATAQSLATDHGKQTWLDVTARLRMHSEHLLADALARDPAFSARRARLTKLAKALAALPWHRVKHESLHGELARSELRVAKAERKAKAAMSPAAVHRWRRRMRRLRMQVDAMGRIEICHESLRAMQGERIRELKKRTDLLGRRQDLEVLKRLLPKVSDAADLVTLRRRLQQEIADLDGAG